MTYYLYVSIKNRWIWNEKLFEKVIFYYEFVLITTIIENKTCMIANNTSGRMFQEVKTNIVNDSSWDLPFFDLILLKTSANLVFAWVCVSL